MNTEEAIISALEYERKVRDHYAQAAEKTDDPKGKEIFEALAQEEQYHVDYLEARLQYWIDEGCLDVFILETTLPTREWMARGKAKMRKVSLDRSYANEIKMLKDALELEWQVSEHYKRLVSSLDGDSKEMFRYFLEIEDAHTAIVQAEIDGLEKNGFWFDIAEFNLEAG